MFGRSVTGTIRGMEREPLVYREEVTATLFALADINVKIARIVQLMEDEIGGEEGLQEDDT